MDEDLYDYDVDQTQNEKRLEENRENLIRENIAKVF